MALSRILKSPGRLMNKGTSKLYEIAAQQLILDRQLHHPNPLTRFGKKCFSQSDEDGITFEILQRLGIDVGTFAEFGVGDGLENNTLALVAMGWTGFWVGGEDLAFDAGESRRLSYEKAWVHRDNAVDLFKRGVSNLPSEDVDVLSIDLDGNDLYICEEIIAKGSSPALIIMECNTSFPPPIRFCIEYDQSHIWEGDNYYGASLASLVDMMNKYEYQLVCCNAATGSNAFFVKNENTHFFPEVPDRIDDIYVPPNHHIPRRFGHRTSLRTVQRLIA
ncbi:MAG: hypothetical protein AAF234_02290 [Pseudomonadota bacterium]